MDNDILIISEKTQKAYLPYKYNDLKRILNNSKTYSSILQIIHDLYVIPLAKFRHPIISRFREAYNLVVYKEKKSTLKALDLGFELMFKYKLNPIIIAACRNLEELDIYLDCLEENELFDFKCFEIRNEYINQ